VDVGFPLLGDGDREIGGVGVEDVDVVGPEDGGQAFGRSRSSYLVRMRTEIGAA